MLENAATIERFGNLPLGSEWKNETEIAKKKQYQRLDKVYEFHTKEGNETINKYDKKQILRKYKRLYLYVADI